MFKFFANKKIDNLLEEIEQLKKLSHIDPLTDIYNRRGLLEEAEKIFQEVQRNKQGDNERSFQIKDFTILFLDADNFKSVNDTFGHDVGDKVLCIIADTIKKNVRKLDVVGRFGGEEFVIGLVGANQEYGRQIAERIREDIANLKLKVRRDKLSLTASIGVKQQDNEEEVLDLVFAADKLMYKAKLSGKNKVVVAQPPAKRQAKKAKPDPEVPLDIETYYMGRTAEF